MIELTEQDTVLNHALLRERLRPWIARGALVAVDDAGAGFTSLEYVADIRPDFLKLSRGMVAGVDRDATREDVLRATAAFAREVGARIVAEGVERPEELETLRAMEIDYGQGWLFGRPGEAWPRDTPAARLPVARAPRSAAGSSATSNAPARRAKPARRSSSTSPAAACCPAVFLAQDGRLRCQAVRGFWQVYDGLPLRAGIVGRVFRTGVAAVRRRHQRRARLSARRARRPRRGLPSRWSSPASVVGVLDGQSLTAIDAATVTEIERCAELLSARLEEVGAIGAASPAQRLARTAARLAAADGPEASCARRSPPRSSSRAASPASSRSPTATARSTRTSPRARSASPSASSPSEELASMASWVDDGTSTYTVGDTAGRGFVGHEVLRRTGVGSLIVLPLAVAGERLGLLVVADRANRRAAPEDIELLELLALQAATGLRMASALAELRERVAREALPGQASLLALPDPARPVVAQPTTSR